ncbi:ATP-binding protein [Roseomonas sp. CCTCC AB2023176]|uniref:ATP-binding protein n=1 Tax=Roseomonas sp. CCTCC AB2023176 TaxID=3342640 RepID=UPI0035D89727
MPATMLAVVAPGVRRSAETDVLDAARRTALLLASQIRASFEIQEAILLAVQQRVGGVGYDGMTLDRYLHDSLRALDTATPTTSGLVVTDPAGRMVAHSRIPPPVPMLDLGDRDYVQAHRAGVSGTYVSGVFTTRPSGRRVFVLSRNLPEEPGREPGGAAASAFEERSFENLARLALLHRGDSVALIREAGDILSRQPPLPAEALARRVAPDWLRTATEAAVRGTVVTALSRADDRLQHVAVAQVAGYPVLVAYGVPDDRLQWARWEALAVPALAAIGAAILLLGATAYVHAMQRRREGLEREIEGAARERIAAMTRADLESRLRQAEKLGALGQIAAGIAHDFNNVLQSVRAAGLLLRRRPDDAAAVGRVAELMAGLSDRGEALMRRMTDLSRRTVVEALDPVPALRATADLLRATIGLGIEVAMRSPPAGLPRVHADRGELEAVLVNLAANARDAMEPLGGGRITITAALEDVPADPPHPAGLRPGRHVRITVADDGPGMDAETLARAGEAFFTTKPAGKGTGLGLAMARRFAEGAGGAMRIDSAPGAGTRATLWLRAVEGG